MTAQRPDTLKSSDLEAEFKPVKEHVDLSSVRIQMVIAAALLLAACLAGYWQSLGIGVLYDDPARIGCLAAPSSSSPGGIGSTLSNPPSCAGITASNPPLVSISLLIDQALWGRHIDGFHFTNVLLLFGCALAVSLITLEITGLYGNRLGAAPATWAGLLFAVNPLHVEAAAWLGGRDSLICGLACLASIFSYLRFRLLRENAYLIWSAVLFASAITVQGLALVLPVVVTLAEFILLPGQETQTAGARRTRLVVQASFWAVLGGALAIHALAATVPGAPDAGQIAHAVSRFAVLDGDNWQRALFPAGHWDHQPPLTLVLSLAGYLIPLAAVTARLMTGRLSARPVLFLGGGLLASMTASAAASPISANLQGSQYYLLPTAFICIALSLAAIPALDAGGRKASIALAVSGAALLLLVFFLWCHLLREDMQDWARAAAVRDRALREIDALAARAGPGKLVGYLDCPPELGGRRSTGSMLYLWPGQATRVQQNPGVAFSVAWDAGAGRFLRYAPAQGAGSYTFRASAPGIWRPAPDAAGAAFELQPTGGDPSRRSPLLEPHQDFLRIYPGAAGVTVFLPAVDISPLAAQVAVLDMEVHQPTGCRRCTAGRVELVWQGSDRAGPGEALVREVERGRYLVWLGRYRRWTLAGHIERLGLHLDPGNFFVDLRSIRIQPPDHFVPALGAGGQITWVRQGCAVRAFISTKRNEPVRVICDARAIPGSRAVRLLVTPAGTTFDAGSESDLASPYPPACNPAALYTADKPATAGRMVIPPQALAVPGIHEARLVALDRAGSFTGLPSEPITILVSPR